MADTLPPLPDEFTQLMDGTSLYTAEDMDSYARAALAAVPEHPDLFPDTGKKVAPLKWWPAPTRTYWGDGMMVADIALSNDETLTMYAHKDALALIPQAVPVPADMALVPLEFVRGVLALAHNYSLRAVAPDYYQGTEADAFSNAYARCGADLAKVKAMLAAAPKEQP